MPRRRRYQITVDDAVADHLQAIDRTDRSTILDAIEQQLTHDPMEPTRNRKTLRIPNSLSATFELRCGSSNRYRVFYDVDEERGMVVVLAIGRKMRSSLWIGTEEFEL
jgi:mRNA-degrading endonuclease RelE of RelBE toxin-antitoxin system